MAYTARIPAQMTPETLNAITLIGSVVTLDNQQWIVYAIEGYSYNLFLEGDKIVCDFELTRADWLTQPVAYLINTVTEAKETARVAHLTKGVCLAKADR